MRCQARALWVGASRAREVTRSLLTARETSPGIHRQQAFSAIVLH